MEMCFLRTRRIVILCRTFFLLVFPCVSDTEQKIFQRFKSEPLKYTGSTDFTEIGIFLFPGDVRRGPQMLILYREKDSAIY